MARYNHAYDIAFEVISNKEDASDVTPQMLKEALLRRIRMLDQDGGKEWLDAASRYDTMEDGK